MTNPAIGRKTGAEAKGWKEFVCVVVLYDVADSSYSGEVLVGVARRVIVVKGGWGRRGVREASWAPFLIHRAILVSEAVWVQEAGRPVLLPLDPLGASTGR